MANPLPMGSARKHGNGDLASMSKSIVQEALLAAMMEAEPRSYAEPMPPATARLWSGMVKLTAMAVLLSSFYHIGAALGWN